MSTPWGQRFDREPRSRLASLLSALAVVVGAGAIEVLHGHACTGDGCLLCLIASCAHVLLAAGVGTLLARPIVHIVADLRVAVVPIAVRPTAAERVCFDVLAERSDMTPLAMGVQLLI